MGEVLTMRGTVFMAVPEVLRSLAERDDIERVVVIASRKDGLSEVWFNQQQHCDVVFASAVLAGVAADFANAALAEDDT